MITLYIDISENTRSYWGN